MRLRTRLLAATALLAAGFVAPTPARAEPISASIAAAAAFAGASAAAATVIGSVGSALIGIGVSLGLSYLTTALAPKPTAGEAGSGLETQVQIGGDVARQIPVGRCALKGQLVYTQTRGYENGVLDQVFVLADWTTQGLAEVWFAGTKHIPQQIEAGTGWKTYTIAAYPGLVQMRYYDGTQDAACALLVDTANPPERWTAHARLTGLSYVVCSYLYSQYSALYEGGVPDWTFVVDGARLYDRRFDTSAGGSGPQRWDDTSTWAYTANPAVVRENYLRGFWRSGELILGMGVPVSDLVGDSFVAAANAADEPVTKADGSSEPRYRCGLVLSADDGVTHKSQLDAVGACDAGYLYEGAGLYICQAGVAQAVVRTITDDDLLLGEPVEYAAKRSRAELVNRIHGQFLDPASGWQPQSYAPRLSAADRVADGEELGRALDLFGISSQAQAERVAEIRRREARAQATGRLALGYQHRDLIPGDWLTWNSARFGITRTFRITEREVTAASRAVRLSLEETGGAVYSWSSAAEGAPVPVPVPATQAVLAATVTGFALTPFQAVGSDGVSEVPGLRASWTPVTDPTVDRVVVQVRRVGSTDILPLIDPTPGDGEVVMVGGLLPGSSYEARATIQTTPLRLTEWTSWVPATTGAQTVTMAQIDGRLRDTLAEIGAAARAAQDLAQDDPALALLQSQVHEQLGAVAGRLARAIDTVSERIDSAGGASVEIMRALGAVAGNSAATANEVLRAAATGEVATLTALTTLLAEIHDPASGLPATRASYVAFAQAQATQNAAVSQSLTSSAAQIGQLGADVTAANSARVAGDQALAVLTQAAQATADGASAFGRFAVQARAGANGTDVVLALVASRTSGGATTDVGIYLIIPQVGDARIVLDTAKLLIGSLAANDFFFETIGGQVYLKRALVAPNAIATVSTTTEVTKTAFKSGARTLLATSSTEGTPYLGGLYISAGLKQIITLARPDYIEFVLRLGLYDDVNFPRVSYFGYGTTPGNYLVVSQVRAGSGQGGGSVTRIESDGNAVVGFDLPAGTYSFHPGYSDDGDYMLTGRMSYKIINR